MEPVDQLPGVTFRRVAVRQLPPPLNEKCIASGEVVLSAIINNLELWDEVVRQLECLRIYTVKDLAQQMVAISQQKAHEAKKQLELFTAEATGELETLRQRVSFLEHENRQLLQANTKWAQWAAEQGLIPKAPSGG